MLLAKYTPTIMSGAVLRLQFASGVWDGEINASLDGVSIHGNWPVLHASAVPALQDAIAFARATHEQMTRAANPHAACKQRAELWNAEQARKAEVPADG